jgi:hypothetical protein
MAKRGQRGATPFSLSFLDIMSCGFGAVVLVFLITKHGVEEKTQKVPETSKITIENVKNDIRELSTEIQLLQEAKEALTAEISRKEDERQKTKDSLELTLKDSEAAESRRELLRNQSKSVEEELQAAKENFDEQSTFGSLQYVKAARRISGSGTRQYLTGIRISGERILVLLDVSASMLDSSLANIYQIREMDPSVQKNAKKWKAAKKTFEWVISQLPLDSKFQIYTFSEGWSPALEGTEGKWLDVSSEAQEKAVELTLNTIPSGGTNLESVFEAAAALTPTPDNIILITDGLPTLKSGSNPSGLVKGRERQRLFNSATRALPKRVPVQTILLPLEGDPYAAWSYWSLALKTGGSFVSPSEEWP